MQRIKKIELLVGCFFLLGVSALLFLIFKVANVERFGSYDTYSITAQFDNVGGLKVRSPIKIGGVTVGKITAIDLDTDSYVPVVTMALETQYGYLPETSSASILTSGLLGEQYVGIKPGFMDDDIALLGDGDLLEDTKSAFVLEDMIGQVMYSLGGGGDNDE